MLLLVQYCSCRNYLSRNTACLGNGYSSATDICRRNYYFYIAKSIFILKKGISPSKQFVVPLFVGKWVFLHLLKQLVIPYVARPPYSLLMNESLQFDSVWSHLSVLTFSTLSGYKCWIRRGTLSRSIYAFIQQVSVSVSQCLISFYFIFFLVPLTLHFRPFCIWVI